MDTLPPTGNQATAWPSAAADLSSLIEVQAESVVSRVLLKRPAGNVTLFAFDAGQQLSEHTAPCDALIEVIAGKAQITISGQTHTLGAGRILLLPAGQPHAVHALERMKMLLTMIRE